MNTVHDAYHARGFVLGCEVFAERQECPDRLDISGLRNPPKLTSSGGVRARAQNTIHLMRDQIWYPDLSCAVTVYHEIDQRPDAAAVLRAFVQVWHGLSNGAPCPPIPAPARCRASWTPGVLRPPGQPVFSGRCKLAHGHDGDHVFPTVPA